MISMWRSPTNACATSIVIVPAGLSTAAPRLIEKSGMP
jgi:hypothetical protein